MNMNQSFFILKNKKNSIPGVRQPHDCKTRDDSVVICDCVITFIRLVHDDSLDSLDSRPFV